MAYRDALYEFNHEYWSALMRECRNSVVEVAKIARMNRTNVYKCLHRYGVSLEYPNNRGNDYWQRLTTNEVATAAE